MFENREIKEVYKFGLFFQPICTEIWKSISEQMQ
jgi:hypothetical protein